MNDDRPLAIAAEIFVESEDPIGGRLRLHTDGEPIDVIVNSSAARAIIRALEDMLRD